jgi:hypothetical protein
VLSCFCFGSGCLFGWPDFFGRRCGGAERRGHRTAPSGLPAGCAWLGAGAELAGSTRWVESAPLEQAAPLYLRLRCSQRRAQSPIARYPHNDLGLLMGEDCYRFWFRLERGWGGVLDFCYRPIVLKNTLLKASEYICRSYFRRIIFCRNTSLS